MVICVNLNLNFSNFYFHVITFLFFLLDANQNGEKIGNASSTVENVLEKGEVEATKEGEKEKEKDKLKGKSDKDGEADKDKDSSSEQEVVFIQDMGFTVKIVSPGADPFDIQVSSMELVQVQFFMYLLKIIVSIE